MDMSRKLHKFLPWHNLWTFKIPLCNFTSWVISSLMGVWTVASYNMTLSSPLLICNFTISSKISKSKFQRLFLCLFTSKLTPPTVLPHNLNGLFIDLLADVKCRCESFCCGPNEILKFSETLYFNNYIAGLWPSWKLLEKLFWIVQRLFGRSWAARMVTGGMNVSVAS